MVRTSPKRFLDGDTGRLISSVLEADIQNLEAWYALNGFSEARVGPPGVELIAAPIGDKPGHLRVVVPIVEGEQQRVAQLEIRVAPSSSAPAFSEDELSIRPLEADGPFHVQRLEDLLDRVRSQLDERGYDRALVSTQLDWSADERWVDVLVEIEPGPQRVIDRVIVRGNSKTRERVVRRVLGLAPGMPFSRSLLLEAQRRLYQLGVFLASRRFGRSPGAMSCWLRRAGATKTMTSWSRMS